jgi:Family of unknown function (DUF6191)
MKPGRRVTRYQGMVWAVAFWLVGGVLPAVGIGMLVILITVQLIRGKKRERKGLPVPHRTAAVNGLEHLLVLLTPAKRIELEYRATERERRDDNHDGAPPNSVTIDLDKGVARIRKQ